jgi:hypothetical protein
VTVGVTSISPGAFVRYFSFAAPAGQLLAPGVYVGAGLWPSEPPNTPGLSIGSNCAITSAQFQVFEIQFDASNAVQRFHATFQQTCSGTATPITGEIYIVANPWR